MKKIYLFFILLLYQSNILAFTITATTTNETCSGNGTISIIASNTNPAGTMQYLIYKLPDLVTPLLTSNSPNITGLSSGTYKIVARETVGNTVSSQEIQVTINNVIVPLSYSVQINNQACSNLSSIVVTTITGNAVSYEIIEGPITFPLQSSNVFTNLTSGQYKIRVFDNCGAGVVQEFTVTINPVDVTIGNPVISPTNPPSCNFINVTNTISSSSGTVLAYPLNVNYVIYPPDGSPNIVTSLIVNSGNATAQDVSLVMPDYINQTYTYDITVTDNCNATYTQTFTIDNAINLAEAITPLDCNENYFTLTTTNFTPPYSLNFTNFPAGFTPSTFTVGYPGPFSNGTVQFGSETLITPLGDYSVTVTDACGRTKSIDFSIIFEPILPTASATNNGCLSNSGGITVTIDRSDIVTAIITLAPSSYPNALPHDVSSLIDSSGNLTLNPVPIGNYTIALTDKCGTVLLPLDVTVPDYIDQELSYELRPGCELNKSSILIRSGNGNITNVTILSGPTGNNFSYPYNASSEIVPSSGELYMNDLVAGAYTFEVVDTCLITNTLNVVVDGYQVTDNTISIIEACGSFGINLNHTSNGVKNVNFWLQKLINTTTNTWGHPDSGTVYPNGTLPNNNNSLNLTNNTINLNNQYNGTFRIIKTFNSFGSGAQLNSGAITTVQRLCIEEIYPNFVFNQALEILNATRMPCSPSGSLDVVIDAIGIAPLHYSIIQKDGLPFTLDNGTSNTFTNLQPGEYLFRVEDGCGNIKTKLFNVSQLSSLFALTQPNPILQCQTTITGNETFNLNGIDSTLLGAQNLSLYTISYFESLINAQLNINPIPNISNYNPPNNPQTVYVRVILNTLPNCYETTSFDLIVGQTPKLLLQTDYLECSNNPVILDASVGNLSTTTYSWSNGATTPQVTISQFGTTTLTVTAVNNYGTTLTGEPLNCSIEKEITVTISQLPEIDRIETVDWTANENSITVLTSNNAAYEYSIDGVNYQDENYFYNLVPGVYTVYIRDRLGCGVLPKVVWLLDYPRFFTPNGDGYNDYWRIKNSQYEPHFKVFIYDRYGKFIKYLNPNDRGWDGTLNGEQLFSTDYWFVVYREDGRIHKGHFSMKR